MIMGHIKDQIIGGMKMGKELGGVCKNNKCYTDAITVNTNTSYEV